MVPLDAYVHGSEALLDASVQLVGALRAISLAAQARAAAPPDVPITAAERHWTGVALDRLTCASRLLDHARQLLIDRQAGTTGPHGPV
jgi:hypothetical protein